MLNVSRIETWKAPLEDKPGALAAKLEALAKAGADLEFVISRRSSSQPGMGVVFVTPLVGDTQIGAAGKAGFERSQSLHAVRIDGPDEPGIAFLITRAVAAEGINIRGFSAARQGARFIAHLTFNSADEADRALTRLNRAL